MAEAVVGDGVLQRILQRIRAINTGQAHLAATLPRALEPQVGPQGQTWYWYWYLYVSLETS